MTLTFKEDLKKARTEESVAVGVGGLYSKDEEEEVVEKKNEEEELEKEFGSGLFKL